MLERTAGCLEQGSLRRLLPGSKKSISSRRRLHSAFFQHGTCELDVLPLWQILVRGANSSDTFENKRQHTTLAASTGVFLDFLYPAGAIKALRRCSSWRKGDRDNKGANVSHGSLGQRLYMSTAVAEERILPAASPLDIFPQSQNSEVLKGSGSFVDNTDLHELRRLMRGRKSRTYDMAWEKFHNLSLTAQDEVALELLRFLSQSRSIRDARRATLLFSRNMSSASVEDHLATLNAYITLGETLEAIKMRDLLLHRFKVISGGGVLIAHAISHSEWRSLPVIWEPYRTSWDQSTEGKDMDVIWREVDKLANLQDLCLSLVSFVDGRYKNIASMKYSAKSSSRPESGLVGIAQILMCRAMSPKVHNFSSQKMLKLMATLQRWKVDTPLRYETIITQLLDANMWKLAIASYQQFRGRPQHRIRRSLLDRLLKVFCDQNATSGIHSILNDWYRFYGRPSPYAFRTGIRAFAAIGDSKTVHTLWTQYTSPELSQLSEHAISADDVSIIMHFHAKRGELPRVIDTFDEMESKYKVKPEVKNWNILINAYGKVHDIDGAFERFEQMMEKESLVRPDDYTFGTLMGICITRGDFAHAMELYQTAESLGVERSAAMVDAIVLGHIQEGRLDDAEKICEDAMRMRPKGSCTKMWNFLLTAYAMRRDLANTNRILRRMKSLEVNYDGETYAALMQALAMVKQPDRAYSILTKVLPDSGVTITHFHFAIVMGGYLATSQIDRVFQLHELMKEKKITDSISTKLISLKAAASLDQKLDSKDIPTKKKADEARLIAADKIFYDAIADVDNLDQGATTRKGVGRQPVDIVASSAYFDFMIFVYGQHNAFKRVKQLFELYQSKIPDGHRKPPPLRILSAMMVANWKESNYAEVEECWKMAFAQAKVRAKPISSESTVQFLSIHRLALTVPLSTLMQALSCQAKFDELAEIIKDVQDAGFQLDNKNWNLYIQSLAKAANYKAAFEICETKLMPGWTGWARLRWRSRSRNRLDIQIRNQKKEPTYLRPLYHTFLYLAKALTELEKATENRAAQFVLQDLAQRCPLTVGAVRTMERTGDALETQIMGRKE